MIWQKFILHSKKLLSKRKRLITAIIVLIVATCSVFIILNDTKVETTKSISIHPPGEQDIIIGNKDAEYKVIIYTDYECPYCRNIDNYLILWLEEFGPTNIAFHLRHLPLTYIHPQAFEYGEYVECSKKMYGDSTAFEFGKYVYDNKEKDLGLILKGFFDKSQNTEALQRCVADPKISLLIEQTTYNALLNGIKETPTFLIYSQSEEKYVSDPFKATEVSLHRILEAFVKNKETNAN